ncbi:MAG TPA: ABC transporter ATP-binding protein [Oscillospiraceae bacterium]|nr:ABC transporter ATP-binding protein [Oscillospiraceae bacterium]HPF55983.1 ABC transporter ATP-binding protein [Clostridiales bacterium]HPK34433.1 ABC transporter ATP-binding protein [Oscillospiraceae bacterium]HPR75582.1 ABC transporter ATP-binding protein [Oscillospiraceae bacterium]
MNITVESLYKTFQNPDKEVLKDINLEIAEGEFVCLLGPSGCGKSTLLNIIAGLDTPTSGSVKFGGEPVTGPGPDRVMIFQESALFPWLSVVDNVKFGLKIAKIPDKEAEERAMMYLQKVNLASCRDYKVSQLSGGMKQRVAIARALALNSKALLMDEPFAALDKQTKNLLRDELERLWLSEKRTVVYVTHSVEEALFFGDRVVMMSADPGVIKSIFKIDFPRPRQIDTPAFVKLRHDILADLRVEVERYEK